MDSTTLLSIIFLVAGAVLFGVAYAAWQRARASADAAEVARTSGGRVLLNIEPTTILTHEEPSDVRMKKLANICASVGRRSFGEDLDYSVSSIGRVDRMIRRGWGKQGSQPPSDDAVTVIGAYVGEVLARNSRGRWVSDLTYLDPATLLFVPRNVAPEEDVIRVSPFMMIRQKIANMNGYDLAAAFTATEQKLKELNAA
ncbi:MAG: hypothetical protein IPM61_10140 [Chlorobi bacterium]|nr:MAG: hypothetical protein UZ07_CHB004002997 [Chlorobi bacterium OLB7]MBK8911674.1 hypothetical protein [Chlorobiota bacterium]MBX7216583.1 hypothetical protein [Candidatus Kapabacteria bacterium]